MGKEMGSLRRKGNIPQHPEAWKTAHLQVGLVGFWAWREGWGPCPGQMNVWGHTGFFVIGNSVSALCVPVFPAIFRGEKKAEGSHSLQTIYQREGPGLSAVPLS